VSAFAAICILLILVALAFLLIPLLVRRGTTPDTSPGKARNAAVYREHLAELDAELKRGSIDEAQWQASRDAIERRALDEAEQEERTAPATPRAQRAGIVATIVGITVPITAIALYALLGTPQAMFPDSSAGSERAVTPEQIEAMVATLAERMKTNPADIQGWVMLGRSYAAMGRFGEAAGAYAKAAEQRPEEAQILADYADALGMANNRRLDGQPEALIDRALKADPKNVKALTLAGTLAYQKGDFAKSVALWESILLLVPKDGPFAEQVRTIISDARQRLSTTPAGNGSAAKSVAPQSGKAVAGTALLRGTVSLSPALKAQTSPDDTVFIYARAESGPRMPLAIIRTTVRELPRQFSLDDASAMNPQMKLSAFDKVVVVARISKSGTPSPQKGDFEAITPAMAPRASGIKLEIDRALE
jgi:cytochrome c-type biogenesis protein CcmH